MINFKVGEEGIVYYPCPECGQPLNIMPEGHFTCNKCLFNERIVNPESFIKRHNKTQEVFAKLPDEVANACNGLIGRPITEEVFEEFRRRVENTLRSFQENQQVFEWRLRPGRDHNLQCEFSLITDLDPNRIFKLDYGLF